MSRSDRRHCILIRLEKEAIVAVIDYRFVLVLCHFLWCELDMSKDPGLVSWEIIISEETPFHQLCALTFETHWSSRSINIGLHAPAASTTLSAWYFVPSMVSTPLQVTPSAARRGCLKVPALEVSVSKGGTSVKICASYPPKPNVTP